MELWESSGKSEQTEKVQSNRGISYEGIVFIDKVIGAKAKSSALRDVYADRSSGMELLWQVPVPSSDGKNNVFIFHFKPILHNSNRSHR